ncbi:MAG: hypothetical protein IJW99_11950, partial [Clostridia bacterium]|nr:hypothetical protein [Clostridia bacterium]
RPVHIRQQRDKHPAPYPCHKDFRRVQRTLQKRVLWRVQGRALPSSAPRYLHPTSPRGGRTLSDLFEQFVKIAENQLFCRILLTAHFHSNCGKPRGKKPCFCLISQQSTDFSTDLWKNSGTSPQHLPPKEQLAKLPKSATYTEKQSR